VNTYALFAELFVSLTGECAGLIVPTGIATDATTAPFFAQLIREERLRSLVDFRNAGFFPGAAGAQGNRFCLLTISRSSSTPCVFAFRLTSTAQLSDDERRFHLSNAELRALNPNTLNAPIFRSRADAELTAKIYAHAPVLIDEAKGKDGNPWGLNFARLFDMSNDSGLFRTAKQLAEAGFVRDGTDWVLIEVRPAQSALGDAGSASTSFAAAGNGPRAMHYVPLYEAKMIHHCNHRWGDYRDVTIKPGIEVRQIPSPSNIELSNPGFETSPRYWVLEEDVFFRTRARRWDRLWFIGWRDITSGRDERTLIGSVIPFAGCNDKFLLCLPDKSPELCACLAADLFSIPLDFVARQKLGGTSFKYFVFKQLSILPPSFYTEPRISFVVPRVLQLTYTSHSLAHFARDLGYDGPPFRWDEDRRAQLRAELDAFYARAYGLTRDELRYILDPADVKGPDYPSETFRVLKEKENGRYGEYRTRRLVLECWDRMEANCEFKAMGM